MKLAGRTVHIEYVKNNLMEMVRDSNLLVQLWWPTYHDVFRQKLSLKESENRVKVTEEEKQCKLQNVLLTEVEGGFQSLEIFRSISGVHVLHELGGFEPKGGNSGEEANVKETNLSRARVNAWIAVVLTFLKK